MLQNKVLMWLMGLFASAVIGIGAWAGSSLSALPVLAYRVEAMEAQLALLIAANTQGARFTAADGLALAEFVRRLEVRIIAVENRLPDRHPAVGRGGG